MSVCEVDDDIYDDIFNRQIAQYVDWGLDLPAARIMADDTMSRSFRRRSDAIAAENQADRDDEFEDRSLGGQRHNLKMEGL